VCPWCVRVNKSTGFEAVFMYIVISCFTYF